MQKGDPFPSRGLGRPYIMLQSLEVGFSFGYFSAGSDSDNAQINVMTEISTAGLRWWTKRPSPRWMI
jgi:hypothetical protein